MIDPYSIMRKIDKKNNVLDRLLLSMHLED